MNNKKKYIAPSAEVLSIFGEFLLGSNDLPGDQFYDEGSSSGLDNFNN